MKKWIIGFGLLVLTCQGCAVLPVVGIVSGIGTLAGKGYFMYREAELKEDLEKTKLELERLKIEKSTP